MIGLLLAMYPAPWRHRYGEEFRAVLESRPLGPFDVADVLISAVDARLAPRRFPGSAGIEGGPSMMLRIGGFGAVAGGALWFVGVAAASSSDGSGRLWAALVAVGTLALLLGFTGLSAFQARRDPILAWAAFIIPALGSLASIVGLSFVVLSNSEDPMILGSLSAWSVWVVGLLATFVGSIFFAIATFRAQVLSRRASISLAVSSLVAIFVAFGFGPDNQTPAGELVLFLSIGSFAGSWVVLGAMALRRGPIRAIAPAT